MHNLWKTMRQQVAQRLNIIEKGLLSQLEIEEVRTTCEGKTGEEKIEEAHIQPEVLAEPTPTEVATTETLRKTA